jgi:hypothetical protein
MKPFRMVVQILDEYSRALVERDPAGPTPIKLLAGLPIKVDIVGSPIDCGLHCSDDEPGAHPGSGRINIRFVSIAPVQNLYARDGVIVRLLRARRPSSGNTEDAAQQERSELLLAWISL